MVNARETYSNSDSNIDIRDLNVGVPNRPAIYTLHLQKGVYMYLVLTH
jgi:hypothetical protein